MDAPHSLNTGLSSTTTTTTTTTVFDQGQDDTFSLDAWASGKSASSSNDMLERRRSNNQSHGGTHSNDPSPTFTEPREQPPWADLKTKAGKDRKRLPLACIACRRKKIKCSGEKPSCTHCSKSRIPCVYKVTQRRAAPRTDYMGMLDKRLKRMEDRVLKIVPKDNVDNIPRAVVKPAHASAQSKSVSSKKRVVDEAFGHDLDGWAADEGEKMDSYQNPNTASGGERRAAEDGTDALPSKEIQMHLAEVFFDYIYGQSYFLLHKGRYMVDLQAGNVPPYLNLAVCAVSARFSNHPDLQTEPAFLRGEQWSKPAQDIALSVFDTPNLNTLIVLILLCLHGFGCCQGGRAWMLSGMAHRMSYALRLHKDPESDGLGVEKGAKLSFVDREIRRRAMWACFCLDRFTSSGTERPMFAGERYMQLTLPVRESMFRQERPGPTEHLDPPSPPLVSKVEDGILNDPKENLGIAAYVIRIIALWGRINDYMNHGGRILGDMYALWSPHSNWHGLSKQLDDFINTLPPRLQYNAENLQVFAEENVANAFLLLHVAYNQSVIFLNRYAYPNIAVYDPCKGEPQSFIDSGRHRALEAANKISDIIGEATKHRMVFPFAGYAAYVSSAIQLYGAFSKDKAVAEISKERLSRNIRYLLKMKKHWGMLHFLTENLKELYRIHAEAASKGAPLQPDSERRRSVYQYADWHERFPRGVSTADLEPKKAAPPKHKDPGGRKPSDLQSVDDYLGARGGKISPPKSQSGPNKSARKDPPRTSSGTPRSVPGVSHSQMHGILSDRTRSPHGLDLGEVSPAQFGIPESYDRFQPAPNAATSTPTSAFSVEIPPTMGPPQHPITSMPHSTFEQGGIPPEMHGQGYAPPMMDVDWSSGFSDEFLGTNHSHIQQWNASFNANMAMPPVEGANFFGIPGSNVQAPWIPSYDAGHHSEGHSDIKSTHA